MSNKRKLDLLIDYINQDNKQIESGASTVFNKNFFVKKYNRSFGNFDYDTKSPYVVDSYEHYSKEIDILPKLEKYDLTPKLIDFNNDTLILSNCGEIITKQNIPSNWKDQIYEIYKMLVKENIYHNDFTSTNVTVLNGKIYLIDFGWVSHNKPQYPYFNLTKDIIDKSLSLYELFENILNKSVNNRLSNINSFNTHVNNYCRNSILNLF